MALSLNRLRTSLILFVIIMTGALVLAISPAAISADEDERSQSIKQFQPITINEDMLLDLEALADDLDPLTMLMLYMQVQNLGEMDSNLSEESFREVDSIDEVSDHLDGSFLTPEYLPDGFSSTGSFFGVGDAGYVSFTINVQAARTISQLLDIDPGWLPSAREHETLTLTLDVPESGLVGWKSGFEMVFVGQIATPELDVPDEMDLEALRESIINDPRLPDELADQLGAIDDWERTVPVPVPDGADYEDLTINGGPGFLLSMDDEGGAVIWEADGVLHAVAGNLSADELQEVAESMQ